MTKNILVIAAHPDDEVFGCGGTMARHRANGDKVAVLFIADGVGARNNLFAENLQKRKHSAENALKILGAQNLGFMDLPDNRLDTVPLLDIIQKIEKVIREFQPSVIYTHHYADLNVDHVIASRATITACRPLDSSSVKELFFYEVPSATDWAISKNSFVPNMYINIQHYFDKKIDALSCYDEEMRKHPHPRSYENLKNLAALRGSTSGFVLAESFEVGRILIP